MPFDGIVTANIVWDLNHKLAGGKIEKVYQPEQDEIVLSIHREKEKYKVFITSNGAHSRIHFIEETPPNPAQPPAFCMLLRKHLQGGRISKVFQKDTERIVEFWIDSFNELGYPITKKLMVEIMGKHSNITLVDGEKGTIIDSIKRVSVDVNRYRQLIPGISYLYPPAQEKTPFLSLTESNFTQLIRSSQSALYTAMVTGIMGLGPFSAISICSAAGVSHDQFCQEIDDQELKKLYSAVQKRIENLREGVFTPYVWLDSQGHPMDFYSYDDSDLTVMYERLEFETISQAEDYYYTKKASSNRIRQKSADLVKIITTALDKLYLKKGRLSQDILQAENSDIYRLKGELLLANLYQIKPGLKSVTVENYYDGGQVEIALDSRLSPTDNSQKYYKKYTKAKTALREKNIQLKETDAEISYLESILQSLEDAETFTDVGDIRQELIDGEYIKRRQKEPTKRKTVGAAPHEFITSDGFRVLAGRNNRQNDTLTMKMASGNDIWFHTKDIPGTHVILFSEGKEVPDTALSEAASIAAHFSKGKQSENVPVDYTLAKYVKKPAGAKPGFVIFTHNKTLYVTPALPELTRLTD